MRQPVRIAVQNVNYCTASACQFHIQTVRGSKIDWVDCCRADCDNHSGQRKIQVDEVNEPPASPS